MPAINLQPFNTIALTTAAQQLTIPSGGHFYAQILNLGPGNMFIKNAGTVAAGDAASFELPLGLTFTPYVQGGANVTGGLWVCADAAGKCSIALVPRN
jgi:hypothetical protein